MSGALTIASVITPDFWHNWSAVLNNNNVYILSHTSETLPPNFGSPNIWPFAALLGVSVVLWFVNRNQNPAAQTLLLAGLAFLSLVMARNIPLFALAAAPIMSFWIQISISKFEFWMKLEEGFAKIDQLAAGSLAAVLVVLGAAGIFFFHLSRSQSTFYRFDPQIFPVQAADWVQLHPLHGNMFNSFNWGGYLLYRFWPRQHVFIDSQSDFYGGPLTYLSENISNGGANWDIELDQEHVDWIIIPISSGLAGAAQANPHWHIAYNDNLTLILIRK